MPALARVPLAALAAVREAATYEQWSATADCPTHGHQLVARVQSMPSMAGYGTDTATTLRCGCVLTDGPDVS